MIEPMFIGVDPDMHFLSFWMINENGGPVYHDEVRVAKKITGRAALREMAYKIGRSCLIGHHFSPKEISPSVGCVEAQELYQFGAGKTKNPRSIMMLATVAGMCLQKFNSMKEGMETYFPPPQEWKGNVPKQIHHARICSRLNWNYDKVGGKDDGYCVPTGADILDISKGEWKHALDSIGLALYARDQWVEERDRDARLSAPGQEGRAGI